MTRPETRPDEELAPVEPAERDPEAPAPDAAEQAVAAYPGQEAGRTTPSRALEVGEWDAVEQSIVVDLDDDYDH
jgi:hypothetical protein